VRADAEIARRDPVLVHRALGDRLPRDEEDLDEAGPAPRAPARRARAPSNSSTIALRDPRVSLDLREIGLARGEILLREVDVGGDDWSAFLSSCATSAAISPIAASRSIPFARDLRVFPRLT